MLTTPEHSAMMDTIEENLANWIERFNYYKEQNEQAVIETAEQGTAVLAARIDLTALTTIGEAVPVASHGPADRERWTRAVVEHVRESSAGRPPEFLYSERRLPRYS